jgi:ATP-dependent helicase/nuclease subunit A
MSTSIGHKAISASAGSGKTFQLTHRYIELMAHGINPDNIAAFTFSRKAAGEIFDSIVKYLCEASLEEEVALRTAERIGKPEFRTNDFIRLLRRFLSDLHRLYIGTLDSFTVNVLGCFPMELGISSGFQLMEGDEAMAKSAQQEVLGSIFNTRYVDAMAQHNFIEAFKQATFGLEEKGLERNLNKFITEYQRYYQALPVKEAWGRRERIWPDGSLWLDRVFDIEAVGELESQLDSFPEKYRERWQTFIDAVRVFDSNSRWTRDIEYLFEKLIPQSEALRNGSSNIEINNTVYNLSFAQRRLVLELLGHVMKTEIMVAMERTQGIYRVLDRYETVYDELVRRKGKLSFTDVQYMLTAANRSSSGARLSCSPGAEARLYIDYRLDSKLDHWLLDEFQDTSDLQWEVLSNLIDEVLQDISGRRSFFYVGDVKQAIYGWRGGNASLFSQILERYGTSIELVPISRSFRSCQPIIDTINKVFSGLPEAEIPSTVIEQWQKFWQEHQCAEDAVPETGYAALLEPECPEGRKKPEKRDRLHVVADILKEITPLERGLSVAILVRSNDAGEEIVAFLREECSGMNIIHEGKESIKNSPVVLLLLSLVKFAAHPGDTFAWRQLQMSPLGRYFREKNLKRETISLKLLAEIQEKGFQKFIRHWGKQLESVQPLDEFGRKRLQELVDATVEFDGQQSRECNSFLRFIDNYMLNEPAAENAVRVMTIHQSKGLGFDIVITPDLQEGRNASIAKGEYPDLLSAGDSLTEGSWVLKMPRKIIAQNDIVLAGELQRYDEKSCFESLCVLYVALTRARQGLYMVTSYPGSGASMVTAARLLKTQLAGNATVKTNDYQIELNGEQCSCLFETGERNWYLKESRKEDLNKVEQKRLPDDFGQTPSFRKRLIRVSPSEMEETERNAGLLFSTVTSDSVELGTAAHELFGRISWANEVDEEKLIQEWCRTSTAREQIKQKAIGQIRQVFRTEELRQVLSRPPGNVELWREKNFEIVIGDHWVTGIFDRVVLTRGADGKPRNAVILDFKSNDIPAEMSLSEIAEQYRSQLSLYGKALSRMLHLGYSQIRLLLLFTRPGRIYELRQEIDNV